MPPGATMQASDINTSWCRRVKDVSCSKACVTIGYGDLVPRHFLTRLLSVLIGFLGILTTGLVAAISVRALQSTTAPDPPVSMSNPGLRIPVAQAQSSRVNSGRQSVVGDIPDNAL